jgi:hypothetical protein
VAWRRTIRPLRCVSSAGPFTATIVAASNLSVGSGVVVILRCLAHLTASARFRAQAPGPVSGQLSRGPPAGGLAIAPRLPVAFRRPAFRFSVVLFPPGSWALLTVGLPANDRTPTGLPRSARTSYDRDGRPLYPGDGGAHPGQRRLPAGACRFAAASPCIPPYFPSAGSRLTRHQRGFKQFARPVFPSPVAARMERAAVGLEPRASHPADQEPTTHAEVGTGHRARTWNTAQLVIVDLQSGSSLDTCDIASHVAAAIVSPPASS